MSVSAAFALKAPQYRRFIGVMRSHIPLSGRNMLALALLGAAMASPSAAATAKAKPAAPAETTASTPAPAPATQAVAAYDRDLLRLSEILGSVHYLRTLCRAPGDDQWRAKMQRLLDLEAGKEADRRQKFTAAFNHGYRAFASIHATCTEAALQAEGRYRAEGATLASEITARFGN